MVVENQLGNIHTQIFTCNTIVACSILNVIVRRKAGQTTRKFVYSFLKENLKIKLYQKD